MDKETKIGESQFGISALFYLTAVIGTFFALATWVVRSDSLGTLKDIPVLVAPTIREIYLGLFALPTICALLVLLMLVLILWSRPRSFTVLMFFGFVAMAVFMDSDGYENSPRILFAMTFSAFVALSESLYRNLPKPQITAASISVFVCFGYYFYLVSFKIVASI